MPKTIHLYDIDWDTSSDDDDSSAVQEECNLPSDVTVVVNRRWNPEEEAADYLSDNFGFCVNGCQWEEVKE